MQIPMQVNTNSSDIIVGMGHLVYGVRENESGWFLPGGGLETDPVKAYRKAAYIDNLFKLRGN